ncbi:Lysophospholipid acyltransferase LPEAT1 [Porphyridium purpureum]|uniref:Lysophospholipid acyltransferase LPEAT1 n=1 Tax=Porphyridium purpureum TaxID=35688 RepID=A0A5J4Z5Z0_PORPP|nr:Lysophospholipid acyltransferase LPEAT1 [Porphyridium purpureum]|eukprot:POR2513..scf295_1
MKMTTVAGSISAGHASPVVGVAAVPSGGIGASEYEDEEKSLNLTESPSALSSANASANGPASSSRMGASAGTIAAAVLGTPSKAGAGASAAVGAAPVAPSMIRNPFMRRDRPWRLGSVLKLIVAPVLVPVRLALLVLLAAVAWVICTLVMLGVPHRSLLVSPISHRRRAWIRGTVQVIARLMLLVCGFVRVRVDGAVPYVAEMRESALILVANHVSVFDFLYFLSEYAPSFVAQSSFMRIPLLGDLAQNLQCIFVNREARAAPSAAELVADRYLSMDESDGSGFPALALFPEGTTSNGDQLLRFSAGAFALGRSVQPVVLSYPMMRWMSDVDPALVGVTPFSTLRLLAEPVLSLNVKYLSVHRPSEEEQADAHLFAAAVQKEMARELGVSCVQMGAAERISRRLSRNGLQMLSVV